MSTETKEPITITGQVVAFTIGGEEYSLPIEQVREVIRYIRPRLVASADPNMVGVISLRGKVIPVTDLAGSLGIAGNQNDESKIVILESENYPTAGVVVDDVKEVLTIDGSEVSSVAGAQGQSIARVGDNLMVMLDIRDIVARSEAEYEEVVEYAA
jgi:purine-binding chemotaxis protein CheW